MPIKMNKGVILLDILIALTLASFVIAAVGESSHAARDIFDRARTRNELLERFEEHEDEELVRGASRPYGNDRIQIDVNLSNATDSRAVNAAEPGFYPNIYLPEISFTAVKALPLSNVERAAGRPLCSVDHGNSNAIGSYFSKNSLTALSFNQINLPIDPILPLTDLEVRDNIAYISADSATASDPDLLIADMGDAANPTLISSISTGPGISAIAVHGKRVYAAAASTAAQLHIIRLDGLSAPTIEDKYQLPLPYATATPPFASSIFYDDGLVYLGTEKWDGDEFSIIDISNPANPIKVGGLDVGTKINDIFAVNGVAYLAASDENQLRIVDASDPSNPIVINSFSPSGWQRQEGKSLSFFEGRLSFGRTSGGFDLSNDRELFAWAKTSSITLALPNSANNSGGIYGIVADRSHLFVASREIDHEFRVFDYLGASEGASGTVPDFASSTSYSLPIAPQTMTCDGNKIYILAHSAPVIYEIAFK